MRIFWKPGDVCMLSYRGVYVYLVLSVDDQRDTLTLMSAIGEVFVDDRADYERV